MIEVEIPGRGTLRIENVVLDYNGTIAFRGSVSDRVVSLMRDLCRRVNVIVASADTYGTVEKTLKEDANLDLEVHKVSGNEREDKLKLIRSLGPEKCAAVGNGANDELMLREAALSVCVVGREGAYVGTLLAADVVVTRPEDALNLFLDERALVATLRS